MKTKNLHTPNPPPYLEYLGVDAQEAMNHKKHVECEHVFELGDGVDLSSLPLREARAAFYRHNRFPQDGGADGQRWSPFACRDLKVYLPNFKWRRRALPLHDLHHVITGYEFSPQGEFQMAAWEFAAGPYPSALSTLFCLPLVCLGTFVIPRKTFAAFVRGRRSKTLYFVLDVDSLLDKTVREVRRELLPMESVWANGRDWSAFVPLVAASALVLLVPFFIMVAVWFLWR